MRKLYKQGLRSIGDTIPLMRLKPSASLSSAFLTSTNTVENRNDRKEEGTVRRIPGSMLSSSIATGRFSSEEYEAQGATGGKLEGFTT